MALATIGSLVVQVDTSSTSQPQVDTFAELKKCAADHVGGRNKSAVLEAAGRGIIEAIHRFNARNLCRFGSETQADANLVDGTNTVTLPNNFFAIRQVQLIDSEGVARRLDYIPWEQWNKQESRQNKEGTPRWWTSRNTFDDGNIILYPTPNAEAAADYDVRVTIFERIERPSSDSDIIDAPVELGPALCWYAGWKLLAIKKGAGDRDTLLARQEWEQWFKDFLKSTNQEPDATEGWYMEWDNTNYPPDDGVYVKLG